MPTMRARQSFKIDRDRLVQPGEEYYCGESVARHHEAMQYGVRATDRDCVVPRVRSREAA